MKITRIVFSADDCRNIKKLLKVAELRAAAWEILPSDVASAKTLPLVPEQELVVPLFAGELGALELILRGMCGYDLAGAGVVESDIDDLHGLAAAFDTVSNYDLWTGSA